MRHIIFGELRNMVKMPRYRRFALLSSFCPLNCCRVAVVRTSVLAATLAQYQLKCEISNMVYFKKINSSLSLSHWGDGLEKTFVRFSLIYV